MYRMNCQDLDEKTCSSSKGCEFNFYSDESSGKCETSSVFVLANSGKIVDVVEYLVEHTSMKKESILALYEEARLLLLKLVETSIDVEYAVSMDDNDFERWSYEFVKSLESEARVPGSSARLEDVNKVQPILEGLHANMNKQRLDPSTDNLKRISFWRNKAKDVDVQGDARKYMDDIVNTTKSHIHEEAKYLQAMDDYEDRKRRYKESYKKIAREKNKRDEKAFAREPSSSANLADEIESEVFQEGFIDISPRGETRLAEEIPLSQLSEQQKKYILQRSYFETRNEYEHKPATKAAIAIGLDVNITPKPKDVRRTSITNPDVSIARIPLNKELRFNDNRFTVRDDGRIDYWAEKQSNFANLTHLLQNVIFKAFFTAWTPKSAIIASSVLTGAISTRDPMNGIYNDAVILFVLMVFALLMSFRTKYKSEILRRRIGTRESSRYTGIPVVDIVSGTY